MEVAMEVEEDLFFADLSKRIALLITDDEDDDLAVHCPSVSLQAFSQVCRRPIAPLPLLYDENCRRESKGTGVFIPRSSLPRRKNRQGRSAASHNSSTTKSSYRSQHEKSRGVSSNNNVTYTSDNHSCNCYYNPKKYTN